MDTSIIFLLLIGLAGGIAVGLQSPMASIIGQRIGTMESVFILHFGGAVLSAIFLFFSRGGQLGQWHTLPWYTLMAGFFGLVVVTAVSTTIPRIGVTATIVLIVAGQLVIGLVLDHFGWLGATVRPIEWSRVFGVVVLFVGVWLIVRQ